jgi:hypothetical protein
VKRGENTAASAFGEVRHARSRSDTRPTHRLLTRIKSLISLLVNRLPTALHIVEEPRALGAALGQFCGKSGVVDRLVRLVHEEEVGTLRTIGSNQAGIRGTDFWSGIEQ